MSEDRQWYTLLPLMLVRMGMCKEPLSEGGAPSLFSSQQVSTDCGLGVCLGLRVVLVAGSGGSMASINPKGGELSWKPKPSGLGTGGRPGEPGGSIITGFSADVGQKNWVHASVLPPLWAVT